jgi:hypothetical protein
MNTTHTIIGPAEDYRPKQIKAEVLYILIRKYNFVKIFSQFLRFRIRAAQYPTHLTFGWGCTTEVHVQCELQFVAYLAAAHYSDSCIGSGLYLKA